MPYFRSSQNYFKSDWTGFHILHYRSYLYFSRIYRRETKQRQKPFCESFKLKKISINKIEDFFY